MTQTVTIVVNGEAREIPHGLTLTAFLASLELDPRGVVVERNREIVRRPAMEATTLEDGDRLELVHFVGGG